MKYGYTTTDGTTYQLLLEKAQKMRKNPTEAESLLWQYLRRNGLKEHFRQQHPICGYIPDFVCLRFRLIIEIDGGYHSEGEQQEQDKIRQDYLEKEGFTVLCAYDGNEALTVFRENMPDKAHLNFRISIDFFGKK